MPLTSKGEKIMNAMEKTYGPTKGEQVFYASKNAGKITGVDAVHAYLDAVTRGDASEIARCRGHLR